MMFDAQIPLPLALYARVESDPDKVFMEEVGGRSETYARFMQGVARWVDILTRAGVAEGDRVGVMMPTSIEPYHIWLACGWLKAWEVPINTAFRGMMLKHILTDAAVKVLVISRHYLPQLEEVAGELHSLELIIVPDDDGGISGLPQQVLTRTDLPDSGQPLAKPAALTPGDVATVLYTSGTTGPSKGCLVPWGEFYWGIDIFRPAKDGTDCQYCPFPINHFSGKCPAYNMIVLGGRVILRERFSTSEFWSDIKKYRCTTTILLGGTATFIARQPARGSDADNPLRTVLMAPGVPDFREFEDRFDVRVITTYGMTEIAWPFRSRPGPLPNAGTCGQVRDGWQVRVVDERGVDLGAGEVGELLVRCDWPHSMMQAYLGRPEATRKAWAGGWFHTGDAFRYDELENFYFVDRFKDAIRRRGENISSYEVESCINEHPAVAASAVIGAPSETGEDEVRALVVAKDGERIDPAELAAFLAPRMPDFMLPRYIEMVDSLPMTPTHKIRKGELRKRGMSERVWDRLKTESSGTTTP